MDMKTIQRLERMTAAQLHEIRHRADADGRIHQLPCQNPTCRWHHLIEEVKDAQPWDHHTQGVLQVRAQPGKAI